MKRSYRLLCLLALFCPTPVWANSIADFFSNCAKPSAIPGRILTVGPRSEAQGAYPGINAALQAARPGDTITLATGDYGDLILTGTNEGGFITIAAAQGQSPRFTKIRIGGGKPASRWRLTGLTVTGSNMAAEGYLATILSSDNIIFDQNRLHSQDGTMQWKPVKNSGSPDSPPHGISARQSSCISIQDNSIRNVFHGVEFGGDQKGSNGKFFLISGNTIDNFAGDGIEHYGSHVRILNNRITNGHNLCNNQCVHSDGIQGWVYNSLPVTNTDVVIDGNTIIAQTSPDLALPVETLQGITIFDGKWDGVRITNNLVITNTWHGISIYGVNNAAIINNTIAPLNPKRNGWIMVNRGKKDPPGTVYNVVRRNNVLPGVIKPIPPTPGFTWDHDIAFRNAEEFSKAFVKFDPASFSFDMRPSRGSPVIGAGSRDGAPATDIEGRSRTGTIDAGAYAYAGK